MAQEYSPRIRVNALAPGFFLVLAFWLSYKDSQLPWPAVLCLAIAGLVHAWDLTSRYKAH
jgi:NAD(P)-dependent dehydrogenase (short-subunit alcohol dehydrogenase family)